jgi:hypothetical protein
MARSGQLVKAPFITTGNPDTVNDTPTTNTTLGGYDTSQMLGQIYRSADGLKEWQYVQLSATSTSGRTPAANDILYWMSSTSTTFDPRATDALANWVVDNQTTAGTGLHVNMVAGLLRNAATRGNYVWAMRKGQNVSVAWNSTSTLDLNGDVVVASTAGNATVVSSTSTASVIATLPLTQLWLGGAGRIGEVNVVTTSTVILNINLDVTGGAL